LGINLNVAVGTSLSGDGFEVVLVLDPDGEHAVLESVVEEDISEGGSDDALDAKVQKGPRGVLSRTAASKVGSSDNQSLGLSERLLVQDEVGVLRPILLVSKLVK